MHENSDFSLSDLEELIFNCPDGIGDLVRMDVFDLCSIPGTDGWIKYYPTSYEFKCLPADLFIQVWKYFSGQEILESDLVFNYNGRLARFLKPIDNPF